MCWSAPVSCVFGTIDMLVIAYLLWRRQGRDTTYACMLGGVAFQEWAQFLVWFTHSAVKSQEECTLPKALTGLGTFVGSSSIPIVLIWRSVVDNAWQQEQYAYNTARIKAFVLWTTSTLLVVMATVYTESFCVMVGPQHHQIWICAQSIYELGGYPLYFLSLTMYGLSTVYGLIALDLPHKERLWIGWIGLVCSIVSYGVYFYTLEACSIWCWSAFSVGVYMCLRQPIKN